MEIATARRIAFAAAAVLGITLAQPAAALGEAQRNVIENVSQAIAGTEVCKTYQPNLGMLSILAIRYAIRFDSPPIKALLEERALFHAQRIKGRTAEDICAALMRLFGPEGSNVKNLVVKPKT